MEDRWLWYLAGTFDTAGSISVNIKKNDRYAIGYNMQPVVNLSRSGKQTIVFGLIDEYSEDKSFDYRIDKGVTKNSDRLVIDNPEEIEKFLEPIIGGFIQQREQAEAMLTEIIPAVKDDKHRTKEGFYELMDAVETIRETSKRSGNIKYTKDYFMKEWKMR